MWYLIPGNHDYEGNLTAQIAYTEVSPRWYFPSNYYTKTFAFNTHHVGEQTLQIVFIDTVELAGLSEDPHHDGPLTGPYDEVAALTQWQWINETLAASTADYLWVAGHYPVWSACTNGPTQVLIDNLMPMMEQYGVTGYACIS